MSLYTVKTHMQKRSRITRNWYVIRTYALNRVTMFYLDIPNRSLVLMWTCRCTQCSVHVVYM